MVFPYLHAALITVLVQEQTYQILFLILIFQQMFAVRHLYSDVGVDHWHSHPSIPTSVAGLQHYHRQRVLRPRTNRSKCFAVGTGTPMCSPNISPLLRRAIWCKTDGDNLDSWAEWVDEWSNWTHFADSAHGKCAKMGARTGNLIGL